MSEEAPKAEVFGDLRRSSEIFGGLRGSSEVFAGVRRCPQVSAGLRRSRCPEVVARTMARRQRPRTRACSRVLLGQSVKEELRHAHPAWVAGRVQGERAGGALNAKRTATIANLT
jgi:hypothetical protein